jgi:hypothetical protein
VDPPPAATPAPLGEADPTFLVIGAQKAGTSWLHRTLGEHPQVRVSDPKELRYFYRPETYQLGRSWYRQHFHRSSPDQRALGESTPNYLWVSPHRNDEWGDPAERARDFRMGAPERVARDLGTDVRLIVLLREPVQRAVSAFYHHLRRPGRIDRSRRFEENAHRFGIVQMGFYAAHLERWLSAFPADRFLILANEEVREHPEEAIRAVHRHIGVDDETPPGLTRSVHTGRKHGGDGVWYWDESRTQVAVGPRELALLREVYAPENARLTQLLGRDPWAAA